MSKDKDVASHPMYYTEAYHRGQVDGGIAGVAAAAGGVAVGGISGAVLSGRTFEGIERLVGESLSKSERFALRSVGGVVGAVLVGVVAGLVGQAAGYIHGIRKGPNPEQLGGWSNKIDQERTDTSHHKSR